MYPNKPKRANIEKYVLCCLVLFDFGKQELKRNNQQL